MRLFTTALAAALTLGFSSAGQAGHRSVAVQSDDAVIVNGDWGATPGFVHDTTSGVILRVKGQRARRQARMALWTAGLAGDRKTVHGKEGFPPFRYYENWGGDLTEVWTYPQSQRRYTFRDGALIGAQRYTSVQFADMRHHRATYRSGYAGLDNPPTSRFTSVDH